jgi:hypothetical protein
MKRWHLRRLCIPAGVMIVMALVHVNGGLGGLGFMAPTILVLAPLLLGRYLGEDRIASLAARVRARRRPRRLAPRVRGHARPVERLLSRGGALIARSLAVRPPPPPLPA